MKQEVITKKRDIEYNGYNLDKEYMYLTTMCPLCGETKLEHFVPIDEDIRADDILEETCLDCKNVLEILETYERVIEQV